MSLVTNAILTWSLANDRVTMKDINQFFEAEDRGREFIHCDDPGLPRGWYGGSKMLETNIAIGAFNYLEIPELIEHLKGLPWEDFSEVQLFLQEQEDDRFSERLHPPSSESNDD